VCIARSLTTDQTLSQRKNKRKRNKMNGDISTEMSGRPRDKICPSCARSYHHSYTKDHCPICGNKLEEKKETL
jgi:rRNA maturation endonuclease Nob1